MGLIPRSKIRRRAFPKCLREPLLREHRIVVGSEVLRDARQVCPVREWVAMFRGPLLGDIAAEWEDWKCGTGPEERGAPALLDAVKEQFPIVVVKRTLHDRAQ